MGSHSRLVVSTLSALIITCLCLSTDAANEDCGLAVYWGRKGFDHSLRELCDSGLYKYVLAAEFDIGKIIGSGGDAQFPAKITVPNISADVRHCQSLGIKVFVSLTGGVPSLSPVEPNQMASILWEGFIEGDHSLLLPFRGSNFDGLDFAVTSGHPLYHRYLAEDLRQRANGLENRKVYLSASPKECSYPSPILQIAIGNGYFDYVWPNFYNDATCDFSNGGIDGLVSSWNGWLENHPPGITTKFMMGLPAAPEAAKTGFVPNDTLAYEILPRIRYNKQYAGVKLWDWYYDTMSGYGQSIRAPVCDYTDVGHARQEELKISQVV